MISTATRQPCAAPTLSHTVTSSARTLDRLASDRARMVPSSSAVSGMMLDVVPVVILATVSTAGSKTLIRLVIMVCRAPTMAAAAGTGSSASAGIAPCPPLPVTRTVNASSEAMTTPGRVRTVPETSVDVMCSENARSTGAPDALSTPSWIMCRAP